MGQHSNSFGAEGQTQAHMQASAVMVKVGRFSLWASDTITFKVWRARL
jgi:hypothetical protein